jgi:hypothetical protein
VKPIRLPLCPVAALRPRQVLLEYHPRPRLASEHNDGVAKSPFENTLE